MPKVLITSPKGKKPLVEAFEKAGATIVKTLAYCPDLIIPTVDEELPFFALNREWFKAQGIEVMVASENTIWHCRDKAEFFRFCYRHGFATIPTLQDDLIAKPRFGKGSKGLIRIDRSYIVQPLLDYPEISIDYFADLNGKCVSLIPRFRLAVKDGASTEMKVVEGFNPDETLRLGVELGLVGHNVIQGFYYEGKFLFSEVNPRFGGGSHLTFSHFDSPKYLLENLSVC